MQSILALQDPDINHVDGVSKEVIDAASFASDLVARYAEYQGKLQWEPWRFPSEEITLTQIGTRTHDDALCGIHYVFDAVGEEIAKLEAHLIFYGYNGRNPFLDFRYDVDAGTVEIDPNAFMTGHEDMDMPIVIDACLAYSRDYAGRGCTCNDRFGTFKRLRRGVFSCR